MKQRRSIVSRVRKSRLPPHPIICDVSHRDTLDRVVDIIELLKELGLSEGLSPSAHAGLYWIHHMLVDAIKYVGEELRGSGTRAPK